MNLLEEFWQWTVQVPFQRAVEADNGEFKEDTSDMVFVDGEEGDFGTIKYLDAKGREIATRTLEGGDRENTEFTVLGKAVMLEKLTNIVSGLNDSLGGFGKPTYLAVVKKGKSALLDEHDPDYYDRIFVNADNSDQALGIIMRKNPRLSLIDLETFEQVA